MSEADNRSAQSKARDAMFKRSKKQQTGMSEYYMVIGAFVVVCVGAVLYVLLNPKKSFSAMPVIDESQILVHNGNSHHMFTQGSNSFFADWTLHDAKTLMQNSIADSPNISPCKSKEDEEAIVPEKFDWREQYPACVQPVLVQGNCSASYAMSTLSTVADRMCQQSNKPVRLSAQEIISCDKSNYNCDGGYVTRTLNFGKRKGFIADECHPYVGEKEECDDISENECRVSNSIYKVIDYCLAQEEEGIKREILKNGPVIGQMTIYTDILIYKDGVYHRTEDAFKFNGQQIVKIVGWDKTQDGQDFWIIENTWGSDWGEDGFIKILAQDKSTQVDFFAIGVSSYPMTMAEFYSMQEDLQNGEAMGEGDEGIAEEEIDLDQVQFENTAQ